MKRYYRRTGLACLVLLLMSSVFTGCMEEKGMLMAGGITPIIDQEGADPYVLKYGDMYYYTKTTGNNVSLLRSDTFSNISAGEICILYEPKSELENLWAPEIFYLDDTWYVYFSANVPGEEMHHMYVLINENDDPFKGEWKCEPVAGMDDKFAIDGTVLELESGRYFIWSGWEGYEDVQQNIYLTQMVSPTEVMNEKILISSPEYEWEKHGNPLINEGPEIIMKENMINLVYSASGSWTDDYCLGLLTADINADIKSPEAWEKQEKPILSSGNDVWGPGHNSFTVSPDETETIIVYHAARWPGAGWSRSVRFGYVYFDDTGKIMNMEPVSSDELIEPPSGEKSRQVYLSDTFKLSEGLVKKEDPGSVSGKVVEGFLDSQESISLNIQGENQGVTTMHIYARLTDSYDDNDVTGIQVEIDGKVYITSIYPADYYQPVSINVRLEKSNNEVVIRSEAGGSMLAIDRIEIG